MATTLEHKWLSSKEIRRRFLDYFHHHAHTIVPSSSLIPEHDPTLLFTNAGMVQFKDVFLGIDKRPYKRAVSSQRCVRAGGKHNDLERVGYTARHHTFFEMLGNFSFGDYFKQEAIRLAWIFLTEELKLPREKLWVTVFETDEEAEKIWLNEIKVPPERVIRCGEQDNFWSMGQTGPCGPCTEIFYDHGSSVSGGVPGSDQADGDRYIEIWNLVFMQYNRAPDGFLTPLPKPAVDTGMGLERITAIMQGVTNNYDTDLFQPIIKAAAQLAQYRDLTHFSLRVIADHLRSSSFLISDGVLPSNEGRGYVLRRIIRRALRHAHQLGLTKPFFYKLVPSLVTIMGEAYPELIQTQALIETTLLREEEQFSITLSQGLKLFDQVINELSGDIISGDIVFKLYDTYGFPVDLTADIAREHHLTIDYDGFEQAMGKQRERSRQASQFSTEYTVTEEVSPTEFLGHKNPQAPASDAGQILALYREGRFVDTLNTGEKGSIVLDRTPFYAESGGQVGDQGYLFLPNQQALFKVHDTVKQGHLFLHLGKMEKGSFKQGEIVTTEVDAKRRAATVLNHTATHLLHNVLRNVLGDHVIQKGSLVEPERLRFDFSHPAPLNTEQLREIEYRVNAEIRANHEGLVHITTPEEATKSGALALFGEKYGNKVRVVSFGSSKELCGGTHAGHTGDIGLFKITAETGIASGIRRIEAVTGEAALCFIETQIDKHQYKVKEKEERILQLEKEVQQLKEKLAASFSRDLVDKAKVMNDIHVLVEKIEGLDGKSLRYVIDQLKQLLPRSIIILVTTKNDKIGIVGSVTANLTERFNAKEIVNYVATQLGGKGGGRAELAEGGGYKVAELNAVLATVPNWLQTRMK